MRHRLFWLLRLTEFRFVRKLLGGEWAQRCHPVMCGDAYWYTTDERGQMAGFGCVLRSERHPPIPTAKALR